MESSPQDDTSISGDKPPKQQNLLQQQNIQEQEHDATEQKASDAQCINPAQGHLVQETQMEPRTPEKAPRIPRDESFKTCKATMPSPASRRQLRATPARSSILSGGKPFKEATSSGRKFNSRKKVSAKKAALNNTGNRLNDSIDSNETFVRHERDLLYDPDSLDLGVTAHKRRQPLDLDDGINRPDIDQLSSSPKKLSPIMKLNQQKQTDPKREPEQLKKCEPRSLRRTSRQQVTNPKPMPTSTPMPSNFLKPKPLAMPRPNPTLFNRYMSSTAKKPQVKSIQQQQQHKDSVFKKPASVISNFSVASSRRCLSQWNTPRITRTQSFKSTAELEREYFSSLRSRF